MERLKPIARNLSGAAAADREPYRPELVAEEEPRYLRRQKPVEIRRRKFNGKNWPLYRRILGGVVGVGVAGLFSASVGNFLLHSPQMLLLRLDQVSVTGNHIVPSGEVQKLFAPDRNKSVLLIPLVRRRAEIEELTWVEGASVERLLPNRLRVNITERTPVAWVRNGTELALIDSHGVLLDRPPGQEFHFPIVTGLTDNLPREERERRIATYEQFLKDVSLVRPGAGEDLSELDLSNPRDLRVVLTGLGGAENSAAVTVHFGASDFKTKYRMLVDNFAHWQATAGQVHSIDLEYSRQVVVNPDTAPLAAKSP